MYLCNNLAIQPWLYITSANIVCQHIFSIFYLIILYFYISGENALHLSGFLHSFTKNKQSTNINIIPVDHLSIIKFPCSRYLHTGDATPHCCFLPALSPLTTVHTTTSSPLPLRRQAAGLLLPVWLQHYTYSFRVFPV